MKYEITIIQFEDEGESLKAQSLYKQTVDSMDIRAVIEAVNADRPIPIQIPPALRKRAPRSDKGHPRSKPEPEQ